MRPLVEDEFDRLGVYASRQRDVEPASTNRSKPHSHTPVRLAHRGPRDRGAIRTGSAFVSVTGKRIQAFTESHVHIGMQPILVSRNYVPRLGTRRVPVYYNGSIPLIGIKAARAAGRLPYPSRTRKISPPAFPRVLECASLWENCLARGAKYEPRSAIGSTRWVRPGGTRDRSVTTVRNWWFAAFHSYFQSP